MDVYCHHVKQLVNHLGRDGGIMFKKQRRTLAEEDDLRNEREFYKQMRAAGKMDASEDARFPFRTTLRPLNLAYILLAVFGILFIVNRLLGVTGLTGLTAYLIKHISSLIAAIAAGVIGFWLTRSIIRKRKADPNDRFSWVKTGLALVLSLYCVFHIYHDVTAITRYSSARSNEPQKTELTNVTLINGASRIQILGPSRTHIWGVDSQNNPVILEINNADRRWLRQYLSLTPSRTLTVTYWPQVNILADFELSARQASDLKLHSIK